MRKTIHLLLLAGSAMTLLPMLTRAQGVGVGTARPDAAAALDITAPDKGLLIPRLDSAARVAIAAPPTGLLVFQTGPRQGFYYYGGGSWLFLPDKARGGDNLGSHTATRSLNLQANTLVGSGATITGVGLGIRADGGLNLGQNTTRNNVFVGFQAGQANVSGSSNYFSGYQAGRANTSGSSNHFSGFQAGYTNAIGNNNHFSGFQSGYGNTVGNANFFSGWQSGYRNESGGSNVFVGYQSGAGNVSGSRNTALGAGSGPVSGGLSNATALGANVRLTQSNTVVLGDNANVGIGTSAPAQQLEVVGTTLTTNAIVRTALTGDGAELPAGLVGVGIRADGGINLGQFGPAGPNNPDAVPNISIGYRAGTANPVGGTSLYLGGFSGQGSMGIQSMYIGFASGSNDSRSGATGNMYTGAMSAYYMNATIVNIGNQFTGYRSGFYRTGGVLNTLIGANSGSNAGVSSDISTAIGANAVVTQTHAVVLGDNASVGIGTSAPIAKLHVNGGLTNDFANTGNISYFAATGGFRNNQGTGAQSRTVCAYFEGGNVFVDNAVHAGRLQVSSDARIKRVLGRSSGAADLALLARLRITDYTYRDTLAHGSQHTKKVIAQEVEQVLPAAVSRSVQALPNVYARATALVYAGGQLTLTCPAPHGLPAAGGRLRLLTAAGEALNPEVAVLDACTVRFAAPGPYPDGLFVYGKFVDDFRSVDYDALKTLNVSATQELARQIDALEAQNAALRARATAAEACTAMAEANHATLQTLKAQMAQLRGEGARAQR